MDSGDNRRLWRLRNGLTRSIGIAKDFMVEKITMLTCDECTSHLSEIADKFKEIWKVVEEIEMVEENDETITALHDELDDCQCKYTEIRQLLKDHQQLADTFNKPESMMPMTTMAVRSNDRGPRLDEGLKLFILSKDHSPVDLRLWKKEIIYYFESGHLSSIDPSPEDTRSQRAHLHRCISTGLMKTIEAEVKPDASVFGPSGYMDALDKIFNILYPIFYRWVQLFKLPTPGKMH